MLWPGWLIGVYWSVGLIHARDIVAGFTAGWSVSTHDIIVFSLEIFIVSVLSVFARCSARRFALAMLWARTRSAFARFHSSFFALPIGEAPYLRPASLAQSAQRLARPSALPLSRKNSVRGFGFLQWQQSF